MNESTENRYESVLRMQHVVFDEVSFNRLGFNDPEVDTEFQFKVEVVQLSDNHYRVILESSATRQNEYEAKIRLSGFFIIDSGVEYKDDLLKENAVAVLFPYLRSEFTLITSQPETDPIVLPVMNIVQMMKDAQDETESS